MPHSQPSALNRLPSSECRLAANRANALLSTGPTTPEGRAKSSLNAVKTGLTVLLPSEDAALYRAHVERFYEELKPEGELEAHLVQSLADTQWSLNRIPGLEAGFFALGHKRYADLFEEEDGSVRAALLDAHILMMEAKHFKNLHLQESRLHRQYKQDMQELRELQERRKEKEQEEAEDHTPLPKKNIAHVAASGFEFTTPLTVKSGSGMELGLTANQAAQ